MEPSAKRRGHAGRVALGIGVIVLSALWLLLWGGVALLAWAFGSDEAGGWLVVSGALAVGLLGLVGGISLVRGRRPGRAAWIAVAVASLPLVAIPVAALGDEGSPAVDRAVARAYMQRSDEKDVEADCDLVWENADGTEFWECILESATVYQICQVDIRRAQGPIAPVIRECL